ncbi:MAG TPA: SMP-30/gluconolactonase/LRE family protein [Chthonomonadaceae bacterium]|nr:SMP-30/gluconolactonase/LRE family protein [Chthonomonadaceae bacterium]
MLTLLMHSGVLALLAAFMIAAATGEPAEPSWSDIMPEGAQLEKVAGGFQFVEGPIWTHRGTLIFSDIPADTLYEWKGSAPPDVFRKPSHNTNGNTLDRQGRLISCEHTSRRVTRTEPNGAVTVLADRYEGKRLNSPNDVVVKSNGDIYFTDPPYGIKPEQEELGFYGVYRLTPHGKLTLLVRDFVRPNGLAFSPDEKRLYIDDSERQHIRVFDVRPDGTLANGRVFADMHGDKPGVPDGMRVDSRGNVYCTGSGGVQVFAPSGKRLGVIAVPEVAANCAWGDSDAKTLYITASTGLYRIHLKIAGARP